jgi:hypothetical protein
LAGDGFRPGNPAASALRPPERWLDRRADLIYGGFPARLTGVAEAHPKALDLGDIRELYERRIGLLVRRGNPGHLLTLGDLAREGIQVLDVQPEEMQEFQDKVPGLRGRLAASVRAGEDGNPGVASQAGT